MSPGDPSKVRLGRQRAMTRGAGVLRSAASLAETADELGRLRAVLGPPAAPAALEAANLLDVAGALVAAATAREESRGAHTRTDFPAASPAFRARLVVGGRPR